jgi:hypothetical protein
MLAVFRGLVERLATALAVVLLKLTVDERVQNGRGHTAETAKVESAKLQSIRYRPNSENDRSEEDKGLHVSYRPLYESWTYSLESPQASQTKTTSQGRPEPAAQSSQQVDEGG